MYNRQPHTTLSQNKSKKPHQSRRRTKKASRFSAQIPQARYAPEKITRDGNRSFDQKQRGYSKIEVQTKEKASALTNENAIFAISRKG
jgi:hypothetical protein